LRCNPRLYLGELKFANENAEQSRDLNPGLLENKAGKLIIQ
jgi:hypothetical protein